MKINSEFKALIPPLSKDEYRQLEANISADGCRDPLVIWDNTLIDGHNRYEICTRLSLPFTVSEITFADANEAKLWMIDNQRGRRNLTDGWRFELAQVKKAILLEKGKDRQGTRSDLLSIVDKRSQELHNTQKLIAGELGWSTGKVAMADKVWKEAAPDIKARVLSGEVSINEAYNDVTGKKPLIIAKLYTGDEEWCTPGHYLESARLVMSGIDLDPASNPAAQENVQAAVYYTQDDDGLSKAWAGKVWLNPPYTARIINTFIDKLVDHFENNEITEAIMLTNNSTDTTWFHSAAEAAAAICFTAGRINFLKPNGLKSFPTNGQAFFYFGDNPHAFHDEFAQYGLIMVNKS